MNVSFFNVNPKFNYLSGSQTNSASKNPSMKHLETQNTLSFSGRKNEKITPLGMFALGFLSASLLVLGAIKYKNSKNLNSFLSKFEESGKNGIKQALDEFHSDDKYTIFANVQKKLMPKKINSDEVKTLINDIAKDKKIKKIKEETFLEKLEHWFDFLL